MFDVLPLSLVLSLCFVKLQIQKDVNPKKLEIPDATLQRIQQVYDSGLMLQAYRAAEEVGPLRFWTGAARTLAGRLAGNLGAYKLARMLHWRAYRENKSDCDLTAYYTHDLLHRRGPLKAWEFLETC